MMENININGYYELDSKYLWHPWSSVKQAKKHTIMVSGEGCLVTSIEGMKYIDATSGALNASCGFSHPEILSEIMKQLSELMNFDIKQFSTIPSIKLAKKIADLLPDGLSRTFFCSSGSEAMETAVKMARTYAKIKMGKDRANIITFADGYHGTTLCTANMSGNPFINDGNDMASDSFYHIDTPKCKKCKDFVKHDICAMPNANQLEKLIIELGSDSVAAFVMEPILGIGGLVIPPKETVKAIKEICSKYNILLVFDETMTSFGRTGKMFGFEHFEVIPDILVTGKGISGGYFPMSTITASEEIYQAFSEDSYLGGFRHGHTNSGHATGAAAALATIDTILKYDLVHNSANIGAYLLKRLGFLEIEYDFVRNLRGMGLVIAMDIIDEPTCDNLVEKCFQNGLIVRQIGSVIGLLPPLLITKEQADQIAEIMSLSFRQISNE